MAQTNRTYGKDSPERFISGALKGGSGPSEEIVTKDIGDGQKINTAFAMDNVDLVMPMDSSIKDQSWRGGPENLQHSLTGASAENEDVGAAGSVKHTRIKDH